MRRTLGTIAALGVIALAFIAPAQADNANRESLRWEGATVSLNPGMWFLYPEMDVWEAATAWGDNIFRFQNGPADITIVDTGKDPRNSMVGATATKTVERGYITSCVIDIKGSGHRKDITAILTHEIGHCLGLGHVYGGEKSVMGTWMSEYSPQRPTKADLQRLAELY